MYCGFGSYLIAPSTEMEDEREVVIGEEFSFDTDFSWCFPISCLINFVT